MSTPARKSGRQAKPTEKFKEYLYGNNDREVPPKIEHRASITGNIETSKETHSAVITLSTASKKRGRPRKSVLEVDPLKIKNINPESEDEDKDIITKDSKNKKGSSKEAKFTPQPESNSSTMTDSESEAEEHIRKIQESGVRRSGRPPKLNKRLLSYLHSDEGDFGESEHLSKKRKEISEILTKRIKMHCIEELEDTKDDNEVLKSGNKKALERLKSFSNDEKVSKEYDEEIADVKKTMINKLEELITKMLEDDTYRFLNMASDDANEFNDPIEALHLETNEEFDDETSEKVRKWLVEEEEDRQRYRRKLLEALKKSHEKSMNMFHQMLKALETD